MVSGGHKVCEFCDGDNRNITEMKDRERKKKKKKLYNSTQTQHNINNSPYTTTLLHHHTATLSHCYTINTLSHCKICIRLYSFITLRFKSIE